MSIRVTINATAIFDTVEQARTAAQATEILLGNAKHVAGGSTLFDFDTQRDVSVHAPVVDRSRFVQGGQAANEKLTKYTTELAKRADHPVDATLWVPLFDHAKQTGEVDLELLTDTVAGDFGLDREGAVTVLAEVISKVNAATAEREYRTAMAPKKVR